MVMLSIVLTDCFIIKLYVIATFIAMPVLPIPPVHWIPDFRKKSPGDFFPVLLHPTKQKIISTTTFF
jgi:hypothetical protein